MNESMKEMPTPSRIVSIGIATIAVGGIILAACSGGSSGPSTSHGPMPQMGSASANSVVVKSRAIVQVTMNGAGEMTGMRFAPAPNPSTSATQSIEVTNAANTSMTIDNSGWIMPTVENSVVDFGYLAIATLVDNNLNTCGAAGNEHCGIAMIRAYNIDRPGAGVWNEIDQYGAPISVSPEGTVPTGTVGLGDAEAYVLQSIEIPAAKRVVRLADFGAAPRYNVKADFTDAGAGSYSAVLVIEYALAPALAMPSPVPSDAPSPVPSPSASPSLSSAL